ncbi:MAG: ABC transporter permease subunit [Dongiaceae bacterium]
MAISTAAGVRAVTRDRLNAARLLGATRAQLLRHVVLPSALPDILTGIRIGLGGGWSRRWSPPSWWRRPAASALWCSSAAQFLVNTVIMGIVVIAAVAFAFEILVRTAAPAGPLAGQGEGGAPHLMESIR